MTKKFEITFTTNPASGIYSANLVNAENAEQATAYYTAKGRTGEKLPLLFVMTQTAAIL